MDSSPTTRHKTPAGNVIKNFSGCALLFLGACSMPADDFDLSMYVLDSIQNTVSKKITDLDYTSYQARRQELHLHPGRGFNPALHSVVAKKPLCAVNDTSENWLRQECHMLQVVAQADYCPANRMRAIYCMAFQLAAFIKADPVLLEAVNEGVRRTGCSSPSMQDLASHFGVKNLHAPGMRIAPISDKSLKDRLKKSRLTPRLRLTTDGTYVLTIYRN